MAGKLEVAMEPARSLPFSSRPQFPLGLVVAYGEIGPKRVLLDYSGPGPEIPNRKAARWFDLPPGASCRENA
jgi:hypothetical protein